MIRAVVASLGFISVLAALIIAALLMVNSMGGSLAGGSAVNAPSEGAAESVVLRISGTPGLQFSGNYTTPESSRNISGTLGVNPTDYDLGGEGVAGFNVVTANVYKDGYERHVEGRDPRERPGRPISSDERHEQHRKRNLFSIRTANLVRHFF